MFSSSDKSVEKLLAGHLLIDSSRLGEDVLGQQMLRAFVNYDWIVHEPGFGPWSGSMLWRYLDLACM